MKRALILSIALGSVLVAGCSKGNKIIGTWDGEMNMSGQSAKITQTFNADKTYTGSFTMEIPQMKAKIVADVQGTWDGTGDTQITTTLGSATVKEAPAMIKEQFQKEIEKEKGKPSAVTLKWNGNDEVVFTGSDGNPVTFKRRK